MSSNYSIYFSLLILLHLLLLTFWLGADLGTFYSSRYVARADLTTPQRLTALKIMAFVDMGPRICLVLFLPSGASLIAADPLGRSVHVLGQSLRGWPIVAIWVGSLVWLALVVADHHYGQNPAGALARRIDTGIRLLAVPVLVGFGLYTLIAHDPFGSRRTPAGSAGRSRSTGWLSVAASRSATSCGPSRAASSGS